MFKFMQAFVLHRQIVPKCPKVDLRALNGCFQGWGVRNISSALTVMRACVLMLSVYIGAWTIRNVPTKTDCLGTRPQRERAVPGLALAGGRIPHPTVHSTASFPKPRRPRGPSGCG